MNRRALFRIEFDGSAFTGWQLQSDEHEEKKSSIQGEVERALKTVLRSSERIPVRGCGRTDAGVHALDYYFHVDLAPGDYDLERLRHALSSVLPDGISVLGARWVPDTFHACDSVVSKTYEYRVLIRRSKPTHKRGRAWWIPGDIADFDLETLKKGLGLFEGEHDFVAFAAANHQAATTVRKIDNINLTLRPCNEDRLDSGYEIRLSFKARGFLKQMVRNMVGVLVELAQKKRSLDSIKDLLNPALQKMRKDAGYCAPSEGLYLIRVEYGNDR